MQIDHDIEMCLEVLHKGGLILYPTDTVWGIGCDATNADAVAKIYALKNRNESKSMIILVAEEEDILDYVDRDHIPYFDFIKGITKPVTVIYNHAINLPANLVNADGSIGIRVVKDPFCKRLIKAFGKPVVSTSSNISGYPPPQVFSDIDISIRNGVDYVVVHRQDDLQPAEPSTVIRLNDDDTIEMIRP